MRFITGVLIIAITATAFAQETPQKTPNESTEKTLRNKTAKYWTQREKKESIRCRRQYKLCWDKETQMCVECNYPRVAGQIEKAGDTRSSPPPSADPEVVPDISSGSIAP